MKLLPVISLTVCTSTDVGGLEVEGVAAIVRPVPSPRRCCHRRNHAQWRLGGQQQRREQQDREGDGADGTESKHGSVRGVDSARVAYQGD